MNKPKTSLEVGMEMGRKKGLFIDNDNLVNKFNTQCCIKSALADQKAKIPKIMEKVFNIHIKKYPDSNRATEYMALLLKEFERSLK